MRNRSASLLVLLSIPLFATLGCSRQPAGPPAADAAKLTMFAPLPEIMPGKSGASPSEEQIALGRMLYYETRLSRSQRISCNSCHQLDKYGVDNHAVSDGHLGRPGDRNSPTVYNAAAHVAQFWDGRAADVEQQAKGPVLNPVEMAMTSEKQVVATLKSMPEYVALFRKAFPGEKDPVTFDNAGNAIGAFERGLVTPARWDRFLKGDQTALTDAEKIGFNTFTAAGCQGCHAGALVGGKLFQKIGIAKAWPDTSDVGRAKVTKSDADRMVFKVPSLRNVAKTGPYFHNGKIVTLEQAVRHMADYQLGTTLSEAQVGSIVTWLNSLTGEIPAEYIKPPELPKSTPKTPKADRAD